MLSIPADSWGLYLHLLLSRSILAAHWRTIDTCLWRRWCFSHCFRRRISCPGMNEHVHLTKRLTSTCASFYLMSMNGAWADWVWCGQWYFLWWGQPSVSRDSCLLMLLLIGQDFSRAILHHYFCHSSFFCTVFWYGLQLWPSSLSPTQNIRSLVFWYGDALVYQLKPRVQMFGHFFLVLPPTHALTFHWAMMVLACILVSLSLKWEHR